MPEKPNNVAAIPDGRSPELNQSGSSTPVYQKPRLRKYDQIEQVKPYGPSEMEAG